MGPKQEGLGLGPGVTCRGSRAASEKIWIQFFPKSRDPYHAQELDVMYFPIMGTVTNLSP